MIRTFITPNTDTFNLSLSIPKDYIGKELEVIAFTTDEGVQAAEQARKKNVSFTALSVDTKNYKFNRDEANER